MNTKLKTGLGFVALIAACLGLFLAGRVGAQSSNDIDQEPREQTEAAPALDEVWAGMTDEERERVASEGNDPSPLIDQLASDEVLVGDADGNIVGHITRDAYVDVRPPQDEDDLHPVFDDAGTVVAYWGGPVGVIDKDLVDEPGELDLGAVLDDRGLTLVNE